MNYSDHAQKFCSNCGALLSAGACFCEECGHPVAAMPGQVRENSHSPLPAEQQSAVPRSRLLMGGVAAVLIVAIVAAGFFGWRLYRSNRPGRNELPSSVVKDSGNPQAKPVANTESTGSSQANNDSPGKSGSKTTGPDLARPETYLPQPGKKYVYFQTYPDGDKGEVEKVTARVSDRTLVSTVEFANSELYNETSIFSEHFLARADGVYSIRDESPGQADLWLKRGLAAGQGWEAGGITVVIKETGASCDLGFTKIENCLVVEKHYKAGVEHSEVAYIAPGYGEVLVSVAPNGSVFKKLTKIIPVNEQQASDIVRSNAPNLNKL